MRKTLRVQMEEFRRGERDFIMVWDSPTDHPWKFTRELLARIPAGYVPAVGIGRLWVTQMQTPSVRYLHGDGSDKYYGFIPEGESGEVEYVPVLRAPTTAAVCGCTAPKDVWSHWPPKCRHGNLV